MKCSLAFSRPARRTVLCLLFGCPSGTPLTFTEVAGQFGITPDMVKRIQTAALAKLRGRIVLAIYAVMEGGREAFERRYRRIALETRPNARNV